MKTLKYVTIFTYLLILSSCQNEAIDNEEQVVDSPEIELINEEYARDIEIYKDSRIVFENSEHNITEVLTDPVLFSYYENAYIYFLDESDDSSILYVSPQDIETAEKMIAQAKEKSRLKFEALKNSSRREGTYDLTGKVYKDINFKGGFYEFNTSGDALYGYYTHIVKVYILPTWIENEASSLRYSVATTNVEAIEMQLRPFWEDSTLASYFTDNAKNIRGLGNFSVGNDNLESIVFSVTTD